MISDGQGSPGRRGAPDRLYLVAIGDAVLTGLASQDGTAEAMEHAIEPVLDALLFSTFLQVPCPDIVTGFRHIRSLGAVLALNFIGAPLVV